MTTEGRLYYIAIVIPEPLSNEIKQLKEEIAARYHCRYALRHIPHITLKAPFIVAKELHEDLVHWFLSMKLTISPFHQQLDGFGCFENARAPVLYINPLPAHQLLALRNEIHQLLSSAPTPVEMARNEGDPHFHVTLANRDLKPPAFHNAWMHYQNLPFKRSFAVQNIRLLSHIHGAWQVVATKPL